MKTGAKSYAVPLINGADTVVLPANDRRVAVILGRSSGGNAWISIGEPAASNQGIFSGVGAITPGAITLEDIGDCIKNEWHCFSSVAGNFLGIIEIVAF